MRAARISVLLLAAYALLWVGGVASHLAWRRTPEGVGWTAPAFLFSAAALLLLNLPGARLWLTLVGVGGFLAELGGSKLGIPFGSYSYTGQLQPQLAGVPVVMFCAWVILIVYVRSSLVRLALRGWVRGAAGATWMTAIDLVIDPVATRALDFWRWHEPGIYYGIPLSNFAGWFLVSAVLLAPREGAGLPNRWAHGIGLSVVLFFGILAAAHRMAAPAAVAAALVMADLAALRFSRRRPDFA